MPSLPPSTRSALCPNEKYARAGSEAADGDAAAASQPARPLAVVHPYDFVPIANAAVPSNYHSVVVVLQQRDYGY
jgi:hypothetical protein